MLNNCAALEAVTVEAGNPAFEAYEGALYTAEGELIFIPEGMTHFTLPADKAALSEDELELLNERTGLTVADVPEESETFNSYGGVIYDADWNPYSSPWTHRIRNPRERHDARQRTVRKLQHNEHIVC